MSETIKVTDLPNFIGQDLEPSSWFEITQERVNQFADATNDHQFIHVDPEKAAKTLFKGPVAHGFLTLSLTPFLLAEKSRKIDGLVMDINYGSDKVRFVQPVPVGSRIRAHQRILEVTQKTKRHWLTKTLVTIEIENQEKPALVAEFILMLVVK